MTKHEFSQLVDIEQIRKLLESHHRISKMGFAVLDTDENVLIAVGWLDICTQFHRTNPVSLARCVESDACIKMHMHHFEGDYLEYSCKNGLVDIAIPIIIEGKHLATVFTGQFFFDTGQPDEEFFRNQAEELGFDTDAYLNALKRVPVFTQKHVHDNILFLRDMVRLMAEIGLKNLKLACELEERKRLEEELSARELEFRSLAENTPNIIIRYDRECRCVYVNPAYMQETGKSYAQVVGEFPEANWVPTMPVEEYKVKLRRVMETGDAIEMTIEWSRTDGQLSSHAFHVVADRDMQGNITGCLAIGHNVTLLKEAEQRLAKLAENSPGVMYSFLLRPDGTSCMPFVSNRIEALIGFCPKDVEEDLSKVFARIHPDDAEHVRESIVESARTLSPWHVEYRIQHTENRLVWVEGRSMPEPQQDGSILWYGFLHDITERKRIDASLRDKRIKLADITIELTLSEERERRRIAAELHDGVGQTLLLSKIKLDSLTDVFVSDNVKRIYEDALSLIERTIKDVRSLTIQLNPPLLAGVGLEAALEWLAKQMADDYALKVDFSNDLSEKPLTEELNVIVYQSARELLINVSKHSGTNRARLTIIRDGDVLVLAVEDDGCGFDVILGKSKQLPLDCSFGLFNIRQRIKLLGGQFLIESIPGSGTNATIIVPVMLDRQ